MKQAPDPVDRGMYEAKSPGRDRHLRRRGLTPVFQLCKNLPL